MKTTVEIDSIVQDISKNFDFDFDGVSEFAPHFFDLPKDFCIGLIVGSSGSGKSTILNSLGGEKKVEWDEGKAICSHFSSAQDAAKKFSAVGLGSVREWVKPYRVLSNGEKFRADMARRLGDSAIVDEFTSVVDRDVARSCSVSIGKYCKANNLKNVVFASCHKDIIDWLNPDWVYDCDIGGFIDRRLERPSIKLKLVPCTPKAWSLFSRYHYLDGSINKSARCWIAEWEGRPVAFAACLAFPSGTIKNAWRGHRTVVLPEFQGLGIGVAVSDAVATVLTRIGCRYFSKTSHYKMGEYRENSPKWKATSKNKKARKDYKSDRKTKEHKYKEKHIERVCYSHEFIG